MSERDKKNKESMSKLLQGLTKTGTAEAEEQSAASQEETGQGATPAQESNKPKARRGRPPRSKEWDTAYIVVNKERYDKIKEIASLSDKAIKDVVDIAFTDYVKKFEKKFGPVRIRRKVDLSSISDD